MSLKVIWIKYNLVRNLLNRILNGNVKVVNMLLKFKMLRVVYKILFLRYDVYICKGLIKVFFY